MTDYMNHIIWRKVIVHNYLFIDKTDFHPHRSQSDSSLFEVTVEGVMRFVFFKFFFAGE